MTPAARIAAVIELLDAVALGREPADQLLRTYTRGRRYIGAKDRRAIADDLYAVLRRVVALDFRLGARTGRLRAAAWAAEQGSLDALFTGEGHAPDPLDPAERQAILAATPLPAWAEANLPEWLVPAFERRFGAGWPAQAAALNQPAPVDLRVNRLAVTRDRAQSALAAAGLTAEPTPYAPDGLRLAGRFVGGALPALADGWVEPQDEGSQLAALAADARPGMTVVDLCAGAGGKTLALAAAMANRGRLIACDTDPRRLARLGPRANRAGVHILDQIIVSDDKSVPTGLAGIADRVLVDAPCSGTGTWRRQPDARLRLTPAEVERLCTVQARLIRRALAIAKPGGLVVYVVCSLLPEEGPGQIEGNLRSRVVPPEGLRAALGLPEACRLDRHGLTLTPLTTGTDGFFIATLTA